MHQTFWINFLSVCVSRSETPNSSVVSSRMILGTTTLFLAINTTSIAIATAFSKSLALAFARFPRKRPASNVRRDVEHEYLNLAHSDFP